MEAIFRISLLANIVLSIFFWCLPYIDYHWLSEEEMILLDQAGVGSSLPPSELWYWSSLLIWLATSVGMYFYNKLARSGFVIMYIISFILVFFYGIQIITPFEAAVSNAIALLDGAILTIAYLTAIGAKFEQNS